MRTQGTMKTSPFDSWTEKYDNWFATPTTQFVKKYELELLLQLLKPQPGEEILDAGCGTGIFTEDVAQAGTKVTGMDISLPMVTKAAVQLRSMNFSPICGDMCALPFGDNSFDKAFSMTAIEFIEDAPGVIKELNRVVKKGGCIVVTTLNSLSPWAERREQKGRRGHSLFSNIYFRSPADMRLLIPGGGVVTTAIHFDKDADVKDIPRLEAEGNRLRLDTGAFLAAQWFRT
jgi:ubiquinone/menaquinone biosynthesis C-methylase UbiE